MSMISLRSRLSFMKGLAPSAATRADLSGSSRGSPADALGDLRVTVRASPPGTPPRTSYSSRSEHPIRFPSDFAGLSHGAPSISFGAPSVDRMSIAASGDGFRSSEDEKSKLSPVQRISFLGVELDSVSMTARLTEERAQAVLNCLSCTIGVVLSFLQERLERRLSPSTLKVYVAAIAAHHDAVDGRSLGEHDLIVRFLKGARRMNPSRPPLVPSWDLSIVLAGLQRGPFEPLDSVELKFLSLKTALLTALTSIKRVGDLQAFSVSEECLVFGPVYSHVVLRPRPGYVPKVPTTPFRDQVVNLQALPSEEADPALALLWPVRALRIYVTRTRSVRSSEQLFVCHRHRLGIPVARRAMPPGCEGSLHQECCLLPCVGARCLFGRHLQSCGLGDTEHLRKILQSSR